MDGLWCLKYLYYFPVSVKEFCSVFKVSQQIPAGVCSFSFPLMSDRSCRCLLHTPLILKFMLHG